MLILYDEAGVLLERYKVSDVFDLSTATTTELKMFSHLVQWERQIQLPADERPAVVVERTKRKRFTHPRSIVRSAANTSGETVIMLDSTDTTPSLIDMTVGVPPASLSATVESVVAQTVVVA